MISVVKLALNNNAVAVNLNILRIGDNRNSEMLCNLRANLSGIAVYCLAACDDNIIIYIAKCACNCA